MSLRQALNRESAMRVVAYAYPTTTKEAYESVFCRRINALLSDIATLSESEARRRGLQIANIEFLATIVSKALGEEIVASENQTVYERHQPPLSQEDADARLAYLLTPPGWKEYLLPQLLATQIVCRGKIKKGENIVNYQCLLLETERLIADVSEAEVNATKARDALVEGVKRHGWTAGTRPPEPKLAGYRAANQQPSRTASKPARGKDWSGLSNPRPKPARTS